MTYDARERSAAQGRPVELYTFARGGHVYRYTSANADQVVAGDTYASRTIARSAIEQGAEMARGNLRLTVPRDLEVAQLYRISPPSDAVTLRLQQFHVGDAQVITVWTGRISTCTPWKAGLAEIVLDPTYSTLRRTGLRRQYQKQCPHVLYGNQCKANPAAFVEAAGITDVTGLVVTSPDFAALDVGYLDGGYLEWEAEPGVIERGFIYAHSGATVELAKTPTGLAAGMDADAFPGCDHTLATCAAKFGNDPNYGGMPFIPGKNPYGNDPIY